MVAGLAVDVVAEIVIPRPCVRVAVYTGHTAHPPWWYAIISTVRWQTPPPMDGQADQNRTTSGCAPHDYTQ
jgi:hypothetical protein